MYVGKDPTLPPSKSNPLVFDPEDTLTRLDRSCTAYLMFLQGNYLAYFENAEDVADAAALLSDATLLDEALPQVTTPATYASLVACRGLLSVHRHPPPKDSRGFWPLRSAQHYAANATRRERELDFRTVGDTRMDVIHARTSARQHWTEYRYRW
jgi:hypothetical protein